MQLLVFLNSGLFVNFGVVTSFCMLNDGSWSMRKITRFSMEAFQSNIVIVMH